MVSRATGSGNAGDLFGECGDGVLNLIEAIINLAKSSCCSRCDWLSFSSLEVSSYLECADIESWLTYPRGWLPIDTIDLKLQALRACRLSSVAFASPGSTYLTLVMSCECRTAQKAQISYSDCSAFPRIVGTTPFRLRHGDQNLDLLRARMKTGTKIRIFIIQCSS